MIPVFNAAQWLEESFHSVLLQTFTGSLEVSVYNDASTVWNKKTKVIRFLLLSDFSGFHSGNSKDVETEIQIVWR